MSSFIANPQKDTEEQDTAERWNQDTIEYITYLYGKPVRHHGDPAREALVARAQKLFKM